MFITQISIPNSKRLAI